MLKHSTRRWLAGVGVAGALVAASATPAAAANAPFEVIAGDMLVAPSYTGLAYVSAAPTDSEQPHQFGLTKLDIDFSGISDFADFVQPWGWACETSAQVVHCEAEFPENVNPSLAILVTGKHNAASGQEGQLRYAMTSGGHTVTATSTVTLAEVVDLETDVKATVTGAPGSQVGMPATVRNDGATTSRGAVLLVHGGGNLVQYAGNFSNCQSIDFLGTAALCTFDEELEPGRSYRLSEELPFQLSEDVRTGAELRATSAWWTKDDWELISKDWPQDGKPGTGAKLRLVEQAGASSETPQTDTNMLNNFTGITVKVTGDNPADLSVKDVTVSGKVGDVVQVRPSFTNLGPALLEFQEGPVFRVTIPEGITAAQVPDACQPYTSDDADWDRRGEPGAKEYGCQSTWTAKGEEHPYEFGLRIDKVVPNASGTLAVRLDGDPNSANDTAKILVNPTDAGEGGGDGGELPITGANTGLIAGVGALLLGAGAAGFVVARRRKTRFVA